MAKVKFDKELYWDDSTGDFYVLNPDGTYDQVTTDGAAHVLSAEGLSAPIAYEQETSLSSATALSGGSLPTGATIALIQAESQNVRWRDDGTNPTASAGQRLLAGESRWFGNLAALKFIEEAPGAKLNVSYY